MKTQPVLVDDVLAAFSYDPDTGMLRRKTRPSNRVHLGDLVGTMDRQGYLRACFQRKTVRVHRLAWVCFYGKWPDGEIDHIDGNRSNNRITNLRDVSRSVNAENLLKGHRDKKFNAPLGVSWAKGKWYAYINTGGRRINLGHFETVEVAQKTYLDAKRRLHAGCTI